MTDLILVRASQLKVLRKRLERILVATETLIAQVKKMEASP